MTFPDRKYSSIKDYAASYFDRYERAFSSVDITKLDGAIKLLSECYDAKRTLFVCGNGGSAAISNHWACDHGKLLATDTGLLPHIESLATNVEVITAIANDISYDEVFVHQLRLSAAPGDLLLTISASGDSENVVKAASWSRENSIDVISLTGFDGGRTAEIATVNLHVDGDNYGVIEDMHQSLMHLMGQYIRQNRMSEDLIPSSKF